MDKKGCTVEVLGVPDFLPDEHTIDKLLIYFLREKHGGGEVLKVLYPCYQPGQAFVTFEQPDVAARVLRRSPHVLELNDQQYYLTVKAADCAQMDFLVEATLQLDAVQDKVKVREILRSRGFKLKDLSSGLLQVRGSFLELKSVKALMEMLLKSAAKVSVTPPPLSPGPKMSSGAISTHHRDVSDAKRSPLESQSQRASASASISSSLLHGSSSPEDFPGKPAQMGSVWVGRACSVVDPDVFDYAKCLRQKDMTTILDGHDAIVSWTAADDHYIISLQGKSAKVCMNKLLMLLDDLHKSLRTQEVPLKDLSPEGRCLAARIQESSNIYKSVLVQKRSSSLHLIGPSGQSYALQQMLLGRTVDQAQQRGRRLDRKPTSRSSLPPPSSHNKEDGAGAAGPSTAREEAAEASRRLGGPV